MQIILNRDNTAFEGRRWCAIVYTPPNPSVSQRICALLPSERQALDMVDGKYPESERYRVVPAYITPAGAWTVDL